MKLTLLGKEIRMSKKLSVLTILAILYVADRELADSIKLPVISYILGQSVVDMQTK